MAMQIADGLKFARRLWKDESTPRFQWGLLIKRVLGVALLFLLAVWSKDAALWMAPWPAPVKYIAVALLLLSVGFLLRGVLALWRALCQLRLRGILIAMVISFGLVTAVSWLTAEESRTLSQQLRYSIRRLPMASVHQAVRIGRAFANVRKQFRVAYAGQRRPGILIGTDSTDPDWETPIPANRPMGTSPRASPSTAPGSNR